jgi:chromate reductase
MDSLPTHPPTLLGLSGSLRAASHNTAVLHSLPALLSGRASLQVMTLQALPPYNADLDGEAMPAPVKAFKQAIAAADALVICSPEYNWGIPGVLKNALDWASRPGYASVLKGKPVLAMTASTGPFGGVRAQAHLRDVLASVLARMVVRQQVAIPAVDQKISNGRLSDETTITLIRAALDDLLRDLALPR